MLNNESFNFDAYDCIGFDLDNTLVEYREQELVELIYDTAARYLVSHYDYNPDYLLKPLSEDIDFIRKGLTLDPERGNVVNLADDGTVLRACHGTRTLTDTEIAQIYGTDRKWDIAVQHCSNLLTTWNGDLSMKIRSSLDCFDMCVPLLFARIIDSIDKKNQKSSENYSVWSHILDTLYYIYRCENFAENAGGYYNVVKQDPVKYMKKRSQKLLDWLYSFKSSNKVTFLITGSDWDYGDFVAKNALGVDWKKYFDVIVYYARKPGFFTQNRPFVAIDTRKVLPPAELKMGTSYREGNWAELRQLFSKVVNKNDPKCLYIGDNLIQDIYAPAKFKCCDTIAVIKELAVECEECNNLFFTSKRWGSLFYDPHSEKHTIWGSVVQGYSKKCIPNLDWFVNRDLRKEYEQLKRI